MRPSRSRLPDVEELDRALGFAYRHLGRRARTVAEVRGHLRARGVSAATSAAAIEALSDQGYLDDARFAARFAADRRALDAWGSQRIERRLLELGVAADLVAAALAALDPGDELRAAVELLERRVPTPPQDDRARNRALGLLVRRGYELELAHDAVRLHGRAETAADGRARESAGVDE